MAVAVRDWASLSYSIVEKHGGRIEVESQPGNGARFRVWLADSIGENMSLSALAARVDSFLPVRPG
jgi:hypothetical protein